MNDKELADALIALGIGFKGIRNCIGFDEPYWEIDEAWFTAEGFVSDWQVAGALMEKMQDEVLIWRINFEGEELISLQTGHACLVQPIKTKDSKQDDSLPRAIIEVCVEALS